MADVSFAINTQDRASPAIRKIGAGLKFVIDRARALASKNTRVRLDSSQVKKTRNEVNRLRKGFKEATVAVKNFGSVFKGSFVGGIALKAVNAIGRSIRRLGSVAIQSAINIENLNVAFNVLLGTVASGSRAFAELEQYANLTPFDTQQVVKAGKILSAVIPEIERLGTVVSQVGDISAALGAPIDELAIVFAKVVANGKLTGEVLQQLRDRAIPLGDVIAKELNIPLEELSDAVSKGAVTTEVFLKAVESATTGSGKFAGAADKLSQTLGGLLSTTAGVSKSLLGVFVLITAETLKARGAMTALNHTLTGWFNRLNTYYRTLQLAQTTAGDIAIEVAQALALSGKLGLQGVDETIKRLGSVENAASAALSDYRQQAEELTGKTFETDGDAQRGLNIYIDKLAVANEAIKEGGDIVKLATLPAWVKLNNNFTEAFELKKKIVEANKAIEASTKGIAKLEGGRAEKVQQINDIEEAAAERKRKQEEEAAKTQQKALDTIARRVLGEQSLNTLLLEQDELYEKIDKIAGGINDTGNKYKQIIVDQINSLKQFSVQSSAIAGQIKAQEVNQKQLTEAIKQTQKTLETTQSKRNEITGGFSQESAEIAERYYGQLSTFAERATRDYRQQLVTEENLAGQQNKNLDILVARKKIALEADLRSDINRVTSINELSQFEAQVNTLRLDFAEKYRESNYSLYTTLENIISLHYQRLTTQEKDLSLNTKKESELRGKIIEQEKTKEELEKKKTEATTKQTELEKTKLTKDGVAKRVKEIAGGVDRIVEEQKRQTIEVVEEQRNQTEQVKTELENQVTNKQNNTTEIINIEKQQTAEVQKEAINRFKQYEKFTTTVLQEYKTMTDSIIKAEREVTSSIQTEVDKRISAYKTLQSEINNTIASLQRLAALRSAAGTEATTSNGDQVFNRGGIVGGTRLTGDSVRARLNSREAVLTLQDQKNLFRIIRNKGAGGGSQAVSVNIDGREIARAVSRQVNDGFVLNEGI